MTQTSISNRQQRIKVRQIKESDAMDAYTSTVQHEMVEDALALWIYRQQVALNSSLPQGQVECLNSELTMAMQSGTVAAVEVVQRYHALVGLLKAEAKYTASQAKGGTPSAISICNLNAAQDVAKDYNWTAQWSKFGTRMERIW